MTRQIIEQLRDQENRNAFNDLLIRYGNFGRFQLLTTIVMFFGIRCVDFFVLSFAFFELFPDFECTGADGITYSCKAADWCQDSSISYTVVQNDILFDNWVNRLDLYCKSQTQIGMIGSLFFIGWASSLLIFPPIADRYGRRPICLYGMMVHLVLYTAIMLCKDYNTILVLMVLFGIVSTISQSMLYVYYIEFIPQQYKPNMGSYAAVACACQMLFLPFYFQFISKNMTYYLLLGVLSNLILVLGLLFLVPESPEFLASQYRIREALDSLKKIATVNGKVDQDLLDAIENEDAWESVNDTPNQSGRSNSLTENLIEGQPAQKSSSKQDLSPMQFCKQTTIMINLVFLCILWGIVSFNFYLVGFQLKYFPGSIFVNSYIVGFSDFMAFLLAGPLYKKLTLKPALVSYMVLTSAGSILILSFSETSAFPVFVLMARFGLASSFVSLYIANADVFPTLFSATAFGACNFVARFATSFAPSLAEVEEPVPMLTCLSLAVFGACCVLFLRIHKYPNVEEEDEFKQVKESMKINDNNNTTAPFARVETDV